MEWLVHSDNQSMRMEESRSIVPRVALSTAYLAMLHSITGVVLGTSNRSEEMVVYDARRRGETVDGGELGGATAPETAPTSANSATAEDDVAAAETADACADAAWAAAVLLLIVVVLFASRKVLPYCRRARRIRSRRYELSALSLHSLQNSHNSIR